MNRTRVVSARNRSFELSLEVVSLGNRERKVKHFPVIDCSSVHKSYYSAFADIADLFLSRYIGNVSRGCGFKHNRKFGSNAESRGLCAYQADLFLNDEAKMRVVFELGLYHINHNEAAESIVERL